LGLGTILVFGHKKLLKATTKKQINTSSLERSSFLISLSAKKDTRGILSFPNFDNTTSLPVLESDGNALLPKGRSRTK
jgi:hypothetical protein